MTENKAILLIGRSGRGKSSLANVITSTDKFKESSGSASETKKVQSETFDDYLIIDTPGIGDTKMSDGEVLNIIAEAVYLGRNGVGQVFFVTDGRFDQYEMATYDLLRTIIFDKDITNHTTIVRTRFPSFKNLAKCQEDIDKMAKEFQEKKDELEKDLEKKGKKLTTTNLSEVIKSCQERVVYVDNPPLDVDDEEELEFNKEDREKSREILLEHLNKISQGEPYKPDKLKELSEDIADDYFQYLKKKEELQKELDEEMKRLSSQSSQSSISQASSSQVADDNQAELTTEEKEKPAEIEQNPIIIGKEKYEKIIAELQDKKERLKKEIAEKEKIIHQKVLKHIFNNYEAINKELGGDIFLNSVAGEHPWPEIHSKFSRKELVVKWLSQGFDYQQTKDWVTVLIDFDPEHDADFCAWLRDKKQLTVEIAKRASYPQNVERLRGEYVNYLQKEVRILDKHSKQLSDQERDWTDIHPDFAKKKYSRSATYQQEWEKAGFAYQSAKEWIQVGFEPKDYYSVKAWKDKSFDYQQTKTWIEVGLETNEYELASYLKEKNYQPDTPNIKEIILQESWRDIHSDFKYSTRKIWEKAEFTYSETQEWIEIGFKPSDLREVKEWKNRNFTSQEAKVWKEIGLGESDYEFAVYLKWKGYRPSSDLNLEQLRGEFNTWKASLPAQEYLDIYYPKTQRKEITKLNIKEKNLQGSLDLSDFANLEKLDCENNKLTELKVDNCLNLKSLICYGNLLTNLDVSKNKEITSLNLVDNNFPKQDLSFLSHLSLEQLWIGMGPLGHQESTKERIKKGIYNRFYGSLEPLKNMTKLHWFNIDNSDISSGLEHLPESVKVFGCLFTIRKDAECKNIYNLFANERGEVELIDIRGATRKIKNFPQKLQAYKQKLQIRPQIEQTLTTEQITSEQLNQQLAKDNYLTNFANTWQKYLDTAQAPEELGIRKEKVLTAIKNLKSEVVGEQQAQIQQTNLPPNPSRS